MKYRTMICWNSEADCELYYRGCKDLKHTVEKALEYGTMRRFSDEKEKEEFRSKYNVRMS